MPRLLYIGGTATPAEIQLRPGVNRFGRSETNDHPIADGSVSSFHCEIIITAGTAIVKDLGSTNGTFVESNPAAEAPLRDGQHLRMGSVEFLFQGDGPPETATPVARPRIRIAPIEPGRNEAPQIVTSPPVAASSGHGENECFNHAGLPAKFVCQNCEARFCKNCVKTQLAGSVSLHSCPNCNGICVTVEHHRKAKTLRGLTFKRGLAGAFVYPFKQNGLILLIGGTFFFTVLQLASQVALPGFASLFLLVTSVGYLFAFMQSVVTSSTLGEENMPDWPEISSFWEDIVLPFLRFVTIWIICLAPGIVALIYDHRTLGLFLLALGILCLPMTLLTVSVADSLGGLNPFVIFSSIAKIPGPYLVVCGLFLAVIGLVRSCEYLLDLFSAQGLPFVALIIPVAIGNFISLYGLTLQMRILGLLYFTKKDQLAWY